MKAAFFAPVEERWIDCAEDYLEKNERLYFVTNSRMVSLPGYQEISHVYFKVKGSTEVSRKADFVEIRTDNPKEYRLPGGGEDGRFYYGFKNLRRLRNPVDLVDLRYFTTGKHLRNDVPGACIIQDPETD